MRVALVTATFPPYRGGTGNVCDSHARELARRGHTVDVFTGAMPGAPSYELAGGAHIRRLRTVLRFGNAPILPGLAPALRGFDLIHLHYPFIFGAEMVGAAAFTWGIPLVISFHNDLIGDGARAPLFSLYQRLSSGITVSGAARLCAVSLDHYTSSALYRSLGNRMDFALELSNGVDVRRFSGSGPALDLARYGIPAGTKVALFVATLDRAHHFKGLSRLLQAARRLPLDVWLLVVGDGDLRTEYEEEARQLGIAGRTVFAGAIDHEDLPPFFRSAHVTVMPSSPPESFGLVLVESMACCTPVVASDIPGVRTVVEHGRDGLLVETADPVALADAIDSILRDDSLRQAIGNRGRAKVEKRYSWELIGAHLEAIYYQLLDELRVRSYAWVPRQL
jgi:glycosyltransferase involved in cell wall biosynthesis